MDKININIRHQKILEFIGVDIWVDKHKKVVAKHSTNYIHNIVNHQKQNNKDKNVQINNSPQNLNVSIENIQNIDLINNANNNEQNSHTTYDAPINIEATTNAQNAATQNNQQYIAQNNPIILDNTQSLNTVQATDNAHITTPLWPVSIRMIAQKFDVSVVHYHDWLLFCDNTQLNAIDFEVYQKFLAALNNKACECAYNYKYVTIKYPFKHKLVSDVYANAYFLGMMVGLLCDDSYGIDTNNNIHSDSNVIANKLDNLRIGLLTNIDCIDFMQYQKNIINMPLICNIDKDDKTKLWHILHAK